MTGDDGEATKVPATQHPAPPLRATARRVGTGTTAKWLDNDNAATTPNRTTMQHRGDWETERRGDEGQTMKGRQSKRKKGPMGRDDESTG